MKVKIMVEVKIEKEIEVEFPYYFKHDLMLDCGDSVIFGEIWEDKCIQIQITHRDREVEYELSIKKDSFERWSCYFNEKYKSSQGKFVDARKKMNDALEEI